jgi:TonB C terminal
LQSAAQLLGFPRFSMTSPRAIPNLALVLACFVLWSALLMPDVQARDGDSNPASNVTMHFSLPAQPLANALLAYGRISRLSVLAQSSLLDNRLSAPVEGNYSSVEALQRLLIGTGTEARFKAGDQAVIVPLPLDKPNAVLDPPVTIAISEIDGAVDLDNRRYVAMVQTRVTEALCASPLARPGNYRLVAQLRIDGAGDMTVSRMAGSTGSLARDTAIKEAIGAMLADWPPPPTLTQPITILMRPHGNGVDTDCAQFEGRN